MYKTKRIRRTLVTGGLQLVVIASVLSINPGLATAQESDKIANAMSAGPAAITAEATILDWPSDPAGERIVLREGTNAPIPFDCVETTVDYRYPVANEETNWGSMKVRYL